MGGGAAGAEDSQGSPPCPPVPARAGSTQHGGERLPKGEWGKGKEGKEDGRGRERKKGLLPEQEACGSLMEETQPLPGMLQSDGGGPPPPSAPAPLPPPSPPPSP